MSAEVIDRRPQTELLAASTGRPLRTGGLAPKGTAAALPNDPLGMVLLVDAAQIIRDHGDDDERAQLDAHEHAAWFDYAEIRQTYPGVDGIVIETDLGEWEVPGDYVVPRA